MPKNRIANNNYIFTNFKLGVNDNNYPTREQVEEYGLLITNDNIPNNSLVEESCIMTGTKRIKLLVASDGGYYERSNFDFIFERSDGQNISVYFPECYLKLDNSTYREVIESSTTIDIADYINGWLSDNDASSYTYNIKIRYNGCDTNKEDIKSGETIVSQCELMYYDGNGNYPLINEKSVYSGTFDYDIEKDLIDIDLKYNDFVNIINKELLFYIDMYRRLTYKEEASSDYDRRYINYYPINNGNIVDFNEKIRRVFIDSTYKKKVDGTDYRGLLDVASFYDGETYITVDSRLETYLTNYILTHQLSLNNISKYEYGKKETEFKNYHIKGRIVKRSDNSEITAFDSYVSERNMHDPITQLFNADYYAAVFDVYFDIFDEVDNDGNSIEINTYSLRGRSVEDVLLTGKIDTIGKNISADIYLYNASLYKNHVEANGDYTCTIKYNGNNLYDYSETIKTQDFGEIGIYCKLNDGSDATNNLVVLNKNYDMLGSGVNKNGIFDFTFNELPENKVLNFKFLR